MKKCKIYVLILCFIFTCFGFGGCATNDARVTFCQDNGDTIVSVVANNNMVQLPADPIREGYGFKGWYTAKNGGGKRITADSIIKTSVVAYAHYLPFIDMTDRNQIEIGGYNGVTEELFNVDLGITQYAKESDFSLLAELGVDLVYLTYSPKTSDVYNTYLDWLDKYKIKAFLRDVELNDLLLSLSENLDFGNATKLAEAVAQVKPLIQRYITRPFFKANFLIDEPLPSQLDSLSKCVQLYQAAIPSGYMYVNLLPNYAPIFDTEQKFCQYVSDFAAKFKVPYLEQDHYPIHTKPGSDGSPVKVLSAADYYKGLYYPATVARDNARDYGNYIWTMNNVTNSENRNYAPSVSDLRFEAFNSMAFGASKINLFCASTPPAFLGVGQAIIDNGQKNQQLWDNTCAVLAEIKALKDVYNKYIWQDAATFYGGNGYGSVMTITLPTAYTSHLQNVKSNCDLLIGLFDQANFDGNGFMLVNNCDINNGENATITFSISGATSVNSYICARNVLLQKNAAGLYTINLEPGQGAFVTVQY